MPSASYDDQELRRRQVASQRAFHRALAAASAGAALIEADGVQATIVPAAPRMALVNGVFYDDAGALEGALPAIAERYAAAAVAHWGVWVPAEDRAIPGMLRAAGHTRRMAPMVMGGALDQAEVERGVDVELDPSATAAMVGRCNDVAFGVRPPDTLSAAFQRDAGTGFRAYVVRREGELACGILVRYHEHNLYTWGLAGTPAARGSLLAIRLMRVVMREARLAGCATVTCETTPSAQAIAQYMRLRPVGRWALWERRRS